MKEIPLSQGLIAFIDDEDYERVNQYKWYAAKNGQTYYAVRQIQNIQPRQKQIGMHRFILNAPKGIEVDHEDHDGLNNQRYNIRLATNRQNQYNKQKYSISKTTSQYKGVHWDKRRKKWRTQIRINSKQTQLGYFENEIEAALAYDQAAIIHHGEFSILNFPIPFRIDK